MSKKKITIPTDLEDIKLGQAQQFLIVQGREDIDDLVKWIHCVATFSGWTMEQVAGIKTKTIKELYAKIFEVLNNTHIGDVKRFFSFKGVEYGLEPDMRQMQAGAFIDIDTMIKDDYIKNLHKIMAILYRPVTSKVEGFYQIADYVKEAQHEKEYREKLFLNKMSYSYVRALTIFFSTLAETLTISYQSKADQAQAEEEDSKVGAGSTVYLN